MKSKKKEKELQLKKKVLEQKILSEEIEKKRLEEEAIKKKEQEESAKKNYNEAEQQRLEALRKINQMKKEISGTNTILEALEQINKFSREKKSVEDNFNQFTYKTKIYYEKLINNTKKLQKDELETTNEYNERIKNEISLLERKRDREIEKYEESVRNELLNGLEKSISEIQENVYDLPAGDYKVTVGKYDADNGFFDVNISILANNERYATLSANFKWDIIRDEAKNIISYRDLLIGNGYGEIVKDNNDYKIGNFSVIIKYPKEEKVAFDSKERVMRVLIEKRKIEEEFNKWIKKNKDKFVFVEGGLFK